MNHLQVTPWHLEDELGVARDSDNDAGTSLYTANALIKTLCLCE